jgi:ATP-binding cassette subfamily F protein 3
MAFVQFTDVSLAFGARDILKGASLYLAEGSRAALAGPNGAGKTTLMKIAAGIMNPDSGERAITKGARISYLPQTDVVLGGLTVVGEAERAFDYVRHRIARQEELGRLLESATDDDGATAVLVEEHARIHDEIERSGYWEREGRVREVLRGLGFRASDLDRRACELSGGWQMRVALAKILLENPDIMLLDEPTNYLDIEARTWLEEFLAKFPGGVLVVSHDRFFLDTTVREVYELWNGRLTRYSGSYSAYEARRAQELESTFEAWERQQEEIQRIEDFIRRFRYKATKAAQVQSRIKMLEKIVPIEIPEGMKKIHFSFPPAPHSGRTVLKIEGLSKSYGENRVIAGLDLEIERGMKVAFVGPNGAGKSTLMRLISGADREYEGSIRYGTGVETAYFAQDSAERMTGERSVEEEASLLCPFELLPKIRNLLGAFLFRGDDVEKKVNVLSGGERSRLALLKMLLKPANLLVLDEPTNHLDLTSKDVLLEALKSFEGTVLFVSHDRDFIESLADHVLELRYGEAPRWYVGDYRYYLDKKASLDGDTNSAGGTALKTDPPRKSGLEPSNGPNQALTVRNYEEEKARKARIRRLQRREEEILARLEAIGVHKRSLEEEMALPENYENGVKMKDLVEAAAKLDTEAESLNLEWERVSTELAGVEGGQDLI